MGTKLNTSIAAGLTATFLSGCGVLEPLETPQSPYPAGPTNESPLPQQASNQDTFDTRARSYEQEPIFELRGPDGRIETVHRPTLPITPSQQRKNNEAYITATKEYQRIARNNLSIAKANTINKTEYKTIPVDPETAECVVANGNSLGGVNITLRSTLPTGGYMVSFDDVPLDAHGIARGAALDETGTKKLQPIFGNSLVMLEYNGKTCDITAGSTIFSYQADNPSINLSFFKDKIVEEIDIGPATLQTPKAVRQPN